MRPRGSGRIAKLGAAVVLVAALVGVSSASAAPVWTKPVTLGPTGRESELPEIAITPEGEAFVTWEGGRPNGIQVTSRRPGQGWRRPAAIAASSGEAAPQIAASGRRAVVVWSETARPRGEEASVVFASTRLPGGRWGKPENISAEKRWRFEPEGREPRVAITNRGEAVVIWTAGDEGHSTAPFIRSATQPPGRGWTSPVGIRGSIEGEEPRLVVTPRGEAVAIWHAFYNEESGLEAASRPPGGKWSVKRLANPGAFPDPELGITPEGEAVAVWEFEEEEPGQGLQVATRRPGRQWAVRTLASAEDERFSGAQVVAGLGGAAVTWLRSRAAGGDEDAVATHLGGGGGIEPASLFAAGTEARRPAVAVTKAGEWIAVWKSTAGAGAGGSIIQASSRRRGQPWEAPVTLSSPPATAPGRSSEPRIAVAPNGEAVAVWQEYDGTGWVVQAATFTSPVPN